MPWYEQLSSFVKPYSEILLILIILISIFVLLFGKKYGKILWATYLISP